MNSLMIVEKMTSMEIAELTGKEHRNILRDIKDEIEKLENGGVSSALKFELRERDGLTGKIPYYELSEEGILQLAARYDAVTRAKLIEKAKGKSNNQIDISKLTPELQMFNHLFQAMASNQLKVQQLESTVSTIKETIIGEPDNWRENINRMCNRIAQSIGENKFRELRSESYKLLESRAGVNLTSRLDNVKIRMLKEGRSKTDIKKANKLDIVEADKKLREIYSKILQEYTIKYCA